MEEPETNGGSNTGALVFMIVFVLITLCTIYVVVTEHIDSKLVIANHQRTEGWIIKYSSGEWTDAGPGNTITYGYRVGNDTLSRKVYTTIDLAECGDEIQPECAALRFWVLYRPDRPEQSLINFKFRIDPANDLVFPSTLEDFY